MEKSDDFLLNSILEFRTQINDTEFLENTVKKIEATARLRFWFLSSALLIASIVFFICIPIDIYSSEIISNIAKLSPSALLILIIPVLGFSAWIYDQEF
jgi:hypothetical protein